MNLYEDLYWRMYYRDLWWCCAKRCLRMLFVGVAVTALSTVPLFWW